MSNVYYLPVPAASAIEIAGPLPAPRMTWRRALTRAGWRVWFAWLELRQALRPSADADHPVLSLEPAATAPDARQHVLLREHAALLGARPAPPIVRARVFDFAAARARRVTV
jgi:hypothetical protein